LAGCLIHAAAVAWIASSLERYTAPFLVFPVATGIALGVGIIALARWNLIETRRMLLLGTMLATCAAVVGQHYFAYLHAEQELRTAVERRSQALARFPGLAAQMTSPAPSSFLDFLDRAADAGRQLPGGMVAYGPGAWLSWFGDGLLVFAGALGVVWMSTTSTARPLDEPPPER
jgi:hypothetical protein